jgi:hypothetical protein
MLETSVQFILLFSNVIAAAVQKRRRWHWLQKTNNIHSLWGSDTAL